MMMRSLGISKNGRCRTSTSEFVRIDTMQTPRVGDLKKGKWLRKFS
jgi:hypothetical protein